MSARATLSHTAERIRCAGVTMGSAAMGTCDVAPAMSAATTPAKARLERGPARVIAHCADPSTARSAISGLEYENRPPMGSSKMLRTVRPWYAAVRARVASRPSTAPKSRNHSVTPRQAERPEKFVVSTQNRSSRMKK